MKIEDLIIDPEEGSFLNLLVFGPSGAGKTYLVGTAQADPRLSPLLVLSFEGGQRTLVGSGAKIVKITSWNEFNEVFEYLSEDDHPYRTVAIDSLAETHQFALFNILDREGKTRRNPDLIDLEDYNTGAVQIRRLVRYFRDLPMNFIATATDRTDIDPRHGQVKKPAMVGRLADEMPGIFECVTYIAEAEVETETEVEIHRVLYLHGFPELRVKVRMPMGQGGDGSVPAYIIEPTMTKLMDTLGY